MCIFAIHRSPSNPSEVYFLSGREEKLDRPWLPPARHWPLQKNVTAGLDLVGGGTWLSLGDQGLLACLLDQPGTLGPQAGKRSRGHLPLIAQRYPDASSAAAAIASLDLNEYRPFHLVLADHRTSLLLSWSPATGLCQQTLPPGTQLITAAGYDPNNLSPRQQLLTPIFAATPPADWPTLVAPDGVAFLPHQENYGTLMLAMIALTAASSKASWCRGGESKWHDFTAPAAAPPPRLSL